jgi:DNA-binding GntR family transcriptional regulator
MTLVGIDVAGGMMPPIIALPLAEIVADRIIDAVTTGHLQSGSRLIESDLAASFGVSRVPVREALRILKSQGLVVIAPHKGAALIQFDAEWSGVTRKVRLDLERIAALRAARQLRSDPAAQAMVARAITEIGAAMATRDLLKVNAADLAYHRVLHDLAGNPLVSALCGAMERHLRILFAIDVQRLNDKQSFVQDHLDLTEALRTGTDDQIDEAVKAHILWMDKGGAA